MYLADVSRMWILCVTILTVISLRFSVQSSSQDDLKRRHRSSQSDESKSAKKSGSGSSSVSNNNGLATGGSGYVCHYWPIGELFFNPLTNHRHQTGPASPLPSAKSLSQALSQSPNNSSSSSG